MLLLAYAWAKPAIPGNPGKDGCSPAAVETALEHRAIEPFGKALLEACPGLPPAAGDWIRSRVEGTPSPRAATACKRAKGDLRGPVSPGFEARMQGVAKACRIEGWDVEAAVGPRALLLGVSFADRLEAGGIAPELAGRVGRRLAGIEGGRAPGRYGSFAREVDGVQLPVADAIRVPLPLPDTATVWLADREAEVASLGATEAGGWLAVVPPEVELDEDAPVYGMELVAADAPAALRMTVSAEGVVIAYGVAGGDVEAAGADAREAVREAREALFAAQEFGGEVAGDETLPERVWIQPEPGLPVHRLAAFLDVLHDEDGTPIFEEVFLSAEGQLAEWPERVDAVGM